MAGHVQIACGVLAGGGMVQPREFARVLSTFLDATRVEITSRSHVGGGHKNNVGANTHADGKLGIKSKVSGKVGSGGEKR